jgi:hypothetical protein
MIYFAYGSNLNAKAVAQWARHYNLRPPPMRRPQAAVLDNHRLCFPIFSEYWGGGIADVVYDPGKYVMGAMFDITDAELAVLDAKVARKFEAGKELGTYKLSEVTVSPLGKTEKIQAFTYMGTNPDKFDIPPTSFYMDLLVQGAYAAGLSMMWIQYLNSFQTQVGRKPRPPQGDD